MVRIDKNILLKLTDKDKERNIYTHPLFLARDIFWQRLEYAFKFLKKHTQKNIRVLDFGGGSGMFAKALSQHYDDLTIIDLDTTEAENIKAHFNLDNITIVNEDINHFSTDDTFDLIIATDVLEHFEDLNIPLAFFKKFLKDDGLLLVTLPTENRLYEFGRVLINKTKPKDHYHMSKDVLTFLTSNHFTIIDKKFVPRYVVPIPLFEVAILQFKGAQDD